jgi:hypothetical protein
LNDRHWTQQSVTIQSLIGRHLLSVSFLGMKSHTLGFVAPQ